MEKIVFVLGDKFPTNYDAAIAIFIIAQKIKSDRMKHVITAYATALIHLWIKSFGEKHLITRGCVTEYIDKLVIHYHNNVYSEHHRTKPKKKGMRFVKKSIRQLNQL